MNAVKLGATIEIQDENNERMLGYIVGQHDEYLLAVPDKDSLECSTLKVFNVAGIYRFVYEPL